MKRGDLVRATDARDGRTYEGPFSGSGDWGVRIGAIVIEDWEYNHFTFEVIG